MGLISIIEKSSIVKSENWECGKKVVKWEVKNSEKWGNGIDGEKMAGRIQYTVVECSRNPLQ